MRIPIGSALFACIGIIGCSNDSGTPKTDNSEEASDAAAVAHADWEQGLIGQSRSWDTATASPVAANLRLWTLCRAPLPGETKGPHAIAPLEPDGSTPSHVVAVNPTGYTAFVGGGTALPVGTVIVKEKYLNTRAAEARAQPVAVAAMTRKEPGFNPDYGDWEYAYIELGKDGRVTSARRGRLDSCIDCHAGAADGGHVFRSYPLAD